MSDPTFAGLRLRFIGSGDAFGSGGRLQTCLCLEGPGGRVLIDCGATALIGMKRAGVDPGSVGCVLLSHLHGDHFGGVPFLVLDGQFGRRESPLVVAGPPGSRERVTAAMEIRFPGSSRAARRFTTDLVEIPPGAPTAIGSMLVTGFILRGQLEIGLSDGTLHRFGRGDARLVEDTTGAGHTTRVVGSGPCLTMLVPLGGDGDH